jgi:hypothetical protein
MLLLLKPRRLLLLLCALKLRKGAGFDQRWHLHGAEAG